jgi:hypothetical protein
VVYCYNTEEDANKGEKNGGSGFLVRLARDKALADPPLYAVTNAHVSCDFESAPVIRLTDAEGRAMPLVRRCEDWIPHPQKIDLAVCRVPILVGGLKYAYVREEEFLTEKSMQEHEIGPGDDVFLVGRFIGASGIQSNTPVARFGCVSMLPQEPINNEDGYAAIPAFLADVRAIGGFSGSPVFIYHTPFCEYGTRRFFESKLLGVESGHFSLDKRNLNSGLTVVIPAWHLSELLALL